jgi:hypothetical protein
MSCPLFSDERECRCGAVSGRHVPTVFERERYCKSNPDGCPTLREHLHIGRRLTEDEYLNLWMPEAIA